MRSRHASHHEVAIGDRPDTVGKGRLLDVNTDSLLTRFEQSTHECLAQVPGTPGNEDRHTPTIFSRLVQAAGRAPETGKQPRQGTTIRFCPYHTLQALADTMDAPAWHENAF
jgi:hypothetical protein